MNHPCVQCNLAAAAEQFLLWFAAFKGKEVMAEINCRALTDLRAALAAANAQHGRSV